MASYDCIHCVKSGDWVHRSEPGALVYRAQPGCGKGLELVCGNWPGIWHLSGSNAVVLGDMLSPECTGANLMLGPIEAGIVLESVVKSGTRFILFPNGNGIFPGSGLPRFGEGLIWIADI